MTVSEVLGLRRRRLLDARDQYTRPRARPREAREDRRQDAPTSCGRRPGRGRRRLVAHRRQARDRRVHRSGARRGPGRAAERHRQRAAPAGRGRPGLELRGARRGVRGPRARRRRSTAPTRRGCAFSTVPSSRLGFVPLADVVQLRRGDGAVAHRSPEPRAQVHAAGKRGAGLRRRRDLGGARARSSKGMHMPRRRTRRRPTGQTREMGRVFIAFVARARAVVHLHVPGARGAVRVVAAPHHDPARRCRSRCRSRSSASSSSSRRSTSIRSSASWCSSAS